MVSLVWAVVCCVTLKPVGSVRPSPLPYLICTSSPRWVLGAPEWDAGLARGPLLLGWASHSVLTGTPGPKGEAQGRDPQFLDSASHSKAEQHWDRVR